MAEDTEEVKTEEVEETPVQAENAEVKPEVEETPVQAEKSE